MNYRDVIRYYGSGSNAAKELRVSRAAVSLWRVRGIAPGRQAQIELATRGKLRASKQ